MVNLSNPAARLAFVAPYAQKFGLDAAIVAAVCEQESGWEPGAVRFEPAFLRRYVVPMNLPLLEGLDRSTSWGLMQIMGQTAIECGFSGNLNTLRDPDLGVYYGCRKLQKCFSIHGDAETALLAYNGGSTAAYPAQVLARVKNYPPPPAAAIAT
jgi:soluble lytic murein transglycosylase-like protein